MDEALLNEQWAEAARDNFYEALTQKDWPLCRAILSDMEEKKINIWKLDLELKQEIMMQDDVYDGAEKDMQEERDRETDHNAVLNSMANDV